VRASFMTGHVSWNPKIRSVFNLLCYVSIVIMFYHWAKNTEILMIL
jgi:hypothetical protein